MYFLKFLAIKDKIHDTTHKYHIICIGFPNQNEDSALFKIIL